MRSLTLLTGRSLRRFLSLALLLGSLGTAHATQTVTYYHSNALGSPVAATDAAGNVLWREAYEPYGLRLIKDANSSGNSRYFTGHPEDSSTGLTYMGSRFYDPRVGRFLSPDPVRFSETKLKSFNRYAYGNNSPYMYVDPNGEHPLWHQLGQVADKALKIIQRVAAPLSRIGRGKNKENGQKNGPGTGQYDDVPEVPEGAGKQRNKPPAPLKEAQGRPHSIVEKSGSKGQYTTHHGDGTWKQYRGSGKPHGNIPRPNVKETGINQAPNGKRYVGKPRVRPVRPDEIPR